MHVCNKAAYLGGARALSGGGPHIVTVMSVALARIPFKGFAYGDQSL